MNLPLGVAAATAAALSFGTADFSGAVVSRRVTPLSAALSRPEFGYVKAARRVREIPDFSESTVAGLERGQVEVFVLYSRQWDPPGSLLRNPS